MTGGYNEVTTEMLVMTESRWKIISNAVLKFPISRFSAGTLNNVVYTFGR